MKITFNTLYRSNNRETAIILYLLSAPER